MSENWRPEINAGDYFGNQRKKLQLSDRRPVVRRASDLVGPAINSTALLITNFNDVLATYNGYFSALGTATNKPSGAGPYVGTVVSDAVFGGVQNFTDLSTGTKYQRIFLRNPGDPSSFGAISWGAWV